MSFHGNAKARGHAWKAQFCCTKPKGRVVQTEGRERKRKLMVDDGHVLPERLYVMCEGAITLLLQCYLYTDITNMQMTHLGNLINVHCEHPE